MLPRSTRLFAYSMFVVVLFGTVLLGGMSIQRSVRELRVGATERSKDLPKLAEEVTPTFDAYGKEGKK
ncbi:MAG: hypothetical protein UY95_C0005G0008 [Parcubacteria group bacterium GW2011_GWA2_56_7]|nr:MAG: hypothetical protein UY95_C0005G0008 [Parcubacteria group bacterium GW2011_GWA2_56_7]